MAKSREISLQEETSRATTVFLFKAKKSEVEKLMILIIF